jgi:hypothetical protein
MGPSRYRAHGQFRVMKQLSPIFKGHVPPDCCSASVLSAKSIPKSLDNELSRMAHPRGGQSGPPPGRCKGCICTFHGMIMLTLLELNGPKY